MSQSLLKEIKNLLTDLNISVETGGFSNQSPNEYVVLVPMSDMYNHFADNLPWAELQEVRLSLFTKNNYQTFKYLIVNALLTLDLVITDRRYVGYEKDTGYFHYVIDVGKIYDLK